MDTAATASNAAANVRTTRRSRRRGGGEAAGGPAGGGAGPTDCPALIGRPVNNIASLAFAMRDGLIYANVHTVAHSGGEVGGTRAQSPQAHAGPSGEPAPHVGHERRRG